MTEPGDDYKFSGTIVFRPDRRKYTFRTTGSHDERGVVHTELLHADFTDLFTNFGEDTGYHGFQRLLLVTAWLVL